MLFRSIRPDPTAPGFKKIIIKPVLVGGLTWVKDKYDSIHGRISTEWRQSAEKFELRVDLPANTTATVFVPTTDPGMVTESGRPASQSKGVTPLRFEAGMAVYQLGSGDYQFKSPVNLK